MLSAAGMELSPTAWAAWMSWRAISRLVQLRASRCWRSQAPNVSGMSGEQVVGEAGLGAIDEGADLGGLEDEGGAVRVGGLAEGDLAAGEFLGFQAGAAVVAP